MNLEGDKMSTSRGWSIEMDEYIADWIRKENGGEAWADVLRHASATGHTLSSDAFFRRADRFETLERRARLQALADRTFVARGRVPRSV
jgi:methionyl-tRNA synthetase